MEQKVLVGISTKKIIKSFLLSFILIGGIMKFSKSKFLSVFCVLFIAAGLVFSGCSSESDGGGETPVTPPSVTPALTGVSITGSSKIAADGTAELTAVPAATGTVTGITYSWEITAGSDYASLSATSGNKVTLTGKNTTASEQEVTVKVTAGTVNATHNVTVGAKAVEPGSGGENSSEDLLITFEKGPVASDSRVSGGENKGYNDTSYSTYNGVAYNYGVKLNSTSSMTVTLEKSYTVVFVLGTDKSGYTKGLTIDGTVFAPVDNTVTATLNEGTHTIKNGGSETSVYLVILKGAGSTTGGGTTPEPSTPEPVVSSVTLSRTSLSLTAGGSETITATVNGTNLTDTSVVWSTDKSGVATVNNGQITAVAAGTAVITATAKADSSKNAACTVTVTAAGGGETPPAPTGNVISITDQPVGPVKIDSSKMTKTATVSTKADFKKYVEAGGYIVYVNGMIDLSDGMLPSTAGGTTTALDAFVVSKSGSKFSSYDDYVTKYAGACASSTDDKSSSSPASTYGKDMWSLNSAYGSTVVIKPKSNTMIIGLGTNSGLKGGSINISGVSNVAVRNLTIQDAYDPFPHHEKGDGFNAQLDCIVIQGTTSNIWIDHCTLKDTMYYKKVAISGGSEKWQTYDGLCDIKGSAASVVVSYCKITAHDKTMLVGSSDTESFSGTRNVTLHHNYFFNCGQRLPFVRMTNIHIYNNYYHYDSSVTMDDGHAPYSQSAAIQVRSKAKIYAEKNYFSSGMQYAYKGDSATDKAGTVSETVIYEVDNEIHSKKKDPGSSLYFSYVNSAPFTPEYAYTADDALNLPETIPANAGAGKWTVQQ